LFLRRMSGANKHCPDRTHRPSSRRGFVTQEKRWTETSIAAALIETIGAAFPLRG
jgi:hypothetical protein